MRNPDEIRHFLSVTDVTPTEFDTLIHDAINIKGRWMDTLRNRTLAIMFEKPSLRTRVSFEMAIRQLGGGAIYLSPAEVGFGKRESVADISRVLSRYVDCVAVRAFDHNNVVELAEHAQIPIVNALTDLEHPCQALADMVTICEHKGTVKDVKIVYVGDGFNVANSLMIACGMTGADFVITSPEGYTVEEELVNIARAYAEESGGKITLTADPEEAVSGADVVYTDTWTSMGQEEEAESRRKIFAAFQVNRKLMSKADPDAIIMHCLPAHHGEEVEIGLLDSEQSVVFDQAENRLHAQKALLARLLK